MSIDARRLKTALIEKKHSADRTLATILRDWSFRYAPLYEAITWLAATLAGGQAYFRRAAWQDLPLDERWQVLDLCCGPGSATRYLAATGAQVTALDASRTSLRYAQSRLKTVQFVWGQAERLPFAPASFDLVHTSVALHEMEPGQLEAIFQQVYRVLRPGGSFVFIDYHQPTNPLFWPPLAIFLWLFETHTAWRWLRADLPALLFAAGNWRAPQKRLIAGGSLQIVRIEKGP